MMNQRRPRTARPILWLLTSLVVIAVAFWFGTQWREKTKEANVTEGTEAVEGSLPQTGEESVPVTTITDENQLTIDWITPAEQPLVPSDNGLSEIVLGTDPVSPQSDDRATFKLGTVRGGTYDGYTLQMFIAAQGIDSPGGTYEHFYILLPAPGSGQHVVILDRYAALVDGGYTSPVKNQTASELMDTSRLASYNVYLDTGATIPQLEESQSVTDKAGRNYSYVGAWFRLDYPEQHATPAGQTVQLTDGTVLTVFQDDVYPGFAQNLFYHVREDGRLIFYDLQLPIGNEKDGVVAVTWNDGTKNTESYGKGKVGGCGMLTQTNVVTQDELGTTLVKAGTYSSGDVYAPSSYDTTYYKEWFDAWKLSDATRTLEQFAALHPFFYVQDSFDRWIQFQRSDVTVAAECGKPVIYLYPEKTTNLDVSLAPVGGFSYTEPSYNNGWRVIASPDGTLVNRDDGEKYPYLFWEGRGGLYSAPTKFWVVKQRDVPSFLSSTLAQLGLNAKETSDFKEFWVPRMQKAAYYKIGFYGNSVMDKIAPLMLSKSADTTIRVLMDFDELNAPVAENPPRLPPTPERKGFTVVEWGGVIQ